MTCKNCIHYDLCKITVADENWTEDAPKELKEMFSPKGCKDFKNKADFVEVVRCRDCRYFTKGMAVGMCKRVKDKPILPCCYDNFCKYGEKR